MSRRRLPGAEGQAPSEARPALTGVAALAFVVVQALVMALVAVAPLGCGGGGYGDDVFGAASSSTAEVYESFESFEPWAVDSADDPAELGRSKKAATHGKTSLRAEFKAGPRRKVSIRRDVPLDLYGVRTVTVDVRTEAEGLSLALALVTLPGDRYFESRAAMVPAARVAGSAGEVSVPAPAGLAPTAVEELEELDEELEGKLGARRLAGWHTVTFRLDGPYFKCAESDWITNAPLANADRTVRLLLVLYTGEADAGEVLFDRITFDKPLAEVESEFAPRNVTARRSRDSARTARVWGRFEVEVEFAASHGSPFDPREVAVYADVAAPSGRVRRAPGFVGRDGAWRVRYMPMEPGRHVYEVVVRNRVGRRTLPVESFVAGGERLPGPVRVSPRDARHFEFASGGPFYPVGINVAWATDFGPYFENFARVGGNVVRVWLAPWSLPVASRKVAGEVDLDAADRLEQVLDLAREHGLLVQLALAYHGEFREGWRASPYNAVNGGPCAVPGDFFAEREARARFRSFMRYVAARFASHEALFAWELFNEADLVPAFSERDVVRWHAMMASALHSYDPARRPVTASVSGSGRLLEIEELDGIDFLQTHTYRSDLDDAVLDQWAAHATRGKPTVIGEFGAHWRPREDQLDPRGVRARTMLWLSLASPASGTALPWWWDVHVESNDLWELWRPVSEIARRIDRRGKSWRLVNREYRAGHVGGGGTDASTPGAAALAPREDAPADAVSSETTPLPGARVHGVLTRTEGLLYFYDPRVLGDTARAPSVVPDGGTITVQGLVDGPYRVETWRSTGGSPDVVEEAVAEDGRLRLALPRSAADFAMYFAATEATEPGLHQSPRGPERTPSAAEPPAGGKLPRIGR